MLTRIRYFLLLLLFALTAKTSFCQSNPGWHQGSILLKSNEVLVGEMTVHLDFNTLVFRSASGVIVFPGYKVSSFRFYDSEPNINRQFVTLSDWQNHHSFYEFVIKGEVSIVRILDRWHSQEFNDVEDYTYFFLHDENLIPIRDFKAKILPDLLNERPDLNRWVKAERLDLNQRQTALLIVKEYNRALPASMVSAR